MRASFILLLLLSISTYSHSQSMQGEWQGSFYSPVFEMSFPIALYFDLKKDSTYKVYSYSQSIGYTSGKHSIIVCQVTYSFVGTDSLHLEEVKVVKPKDKIVDACFQKMFLKKKEKDNKIVLEGTWMNVRTAKCTAESGEIHFTKK